MSYSNFSGLIVVDDIDALSRRGVDTAEEFLFMKAVLARKHTKILYTLRYPPSHALNSTLMVPGLEASSEFFEFLGVCCNQFDVPAPPSEKIPHIQEVTSRLPLLVETLIGLRKHSGGYIEAIKLFMDRGGDEARRYLYQREYDRLSTTGKARHALAGLYLAAEPISFSAFSGLFQFSAEHLRDAISECGTIFIATAEDNSGETLYQLSPPSVPFVGRVSEDLPYFGSLRTRVAHYRSEGRRYTQEEAALIANLKSLIAQKRFAEMVSTIEKISSSDPVLVNPNVQSLIGQAYSELGPNYRERARECFRSAEGLGYRDIHMMRRWFNMELSSGYGLTEADRICRTMVDDHELSPRARSEFWSKLGLCETSRADAVAGVSTEKALIHLRNAVVCYMEGIWVGQDTRGFDLSDNLSWAERPLRKVVYLMGREIDAYFLLLEDLAKRRHDLYLDGATLVVDYLTRSPIPADQMLKAKIKGLCAKTVAAIKRELRSLADCPGFTYLIDSLDLVRKSL